MSKYLVWVSLGLGLALDALLAAVLTYFTSAHDQLITFVWIFLAIALTPVVFGLWGLLKAGIYLFGPARPLMVREYLRVFKEGRFPADDAVDIESYLANAMGSSAVPIETRLKAAQLAGQLAGMKLTKPILAGMPNYLAAEAALHRYQDILGASGRRHAEG